MEWLTFEVIAVAQINIDKNNFPLFAQDITLFPFNIGGFL
jgi:hypothetical protein